MSDSLLDNLGLHINIADLPSAKVYAGAFSAYYGNGWLGRLWAMRLRPIVAPWKHHKAKEQLRRTQRAMRQELMGMVLKKSFALAEYPDD